MIPVISRGIEKNSDLQTNILVNKMAVCLELIIIFVYGQAGFDSETGQ
jgi:hypothetical protein